MGAVLRSLFLCTFCLQIRGEFGFRLVLLLLPESSGMSDSQSEALGELAGIVFSPSFLLSEGVCMRRELQYPDKKSASPSKARSHVVIGKKK